MHRVPPRAVTLLVFASLLISIAGCGGGPASMQSNSASTTPPVAATSNATPGAGASGTASPAPSPTPSSTGTTISNIEQMSGWDSCDLCSGGGPIAYSMTPALSYPQPGSTRFSLAQGAAWGHALWWKRLGTNTSASHFVLTVDEYLENPDASFGIEYEANQIVDGEWYDFATQCSFGYGIWQLWDPANQRWVPTSVPCAKSAPSTHVQRRLEFERSNGQLHFVSIGTNGNIVPVNMAFNPQPVNGTNGDFGIHIQLNADANPDPYSVWVHDFALNYW